MTDHYDFLYKGYGKKGCTSLSWSSKSSDDKLNIASFFQNRLARIGPMYYLSYFASIPLIFAGHSYFGPQDPRLIPGLLESFFGLTSWAFFHGVGPNGPSWSLSTIVGFYLLFPL